MASYQYIYVVQAPCRVAIEIILHGDKRGERDEAVEGERPVRQRDGNLSGGRGKKNAPRAEREERF